MAKNVTPETIYLLTLLDLWCNDYTPGKGSTPVLKFIIYYNVAISSPSGNGVVKCSPQNSLNLVLLEEILSNPDHSRSDAPADGFATFAWEAFVRQILGLNSLDALVQFFQGLKRLFDQNATKNWILPVSPNGTFVRRQSLDFESLQFSDQMDLWRRLVKYRRRIAERYLDLPDLDQIAQATDNESHTKSLEVIHNAVQEPDLASNQVSADFATKLLEFQVDRMQSKVWSQTATGDKKQIAKQRSGVDCYIDLDALRPVCKWRHDSSSMFELKKSRFLDAWFAGDYSTSFECLHRYYDYTMQKNDRSQYQYALLNMAVLHADFGCYSEAISAITEAIAAAREGKDMVCLTYCLSWLYHFRVVNHNELAAKLEQSILGSEASALNHLIGEARKYELWTIESSAKLSEAALCLAKGHQPREIFERISEVEHLNIRHGIDSTTAALSLLKSSIYGRLGHGHLAYVYCDLVTQSHWRNASDEDIVRSICRKAQLVCLTGKFDEAFNLLHKQGHEHARQSRLRQYLMHCITMLKLQKSLLANDLGAAELLLAGLKSTISSISKDFRFHIKCLEIDYLQRCGTFSGAFECIEALNSVLDTQSATADIYERIRVLILKTKLFIKAGRPQKGLTVIMRACTAARESQNTALLFEAGGLLAEIMCASNSYDTAQQILGATIYKSRMTKDAGLYASLATTLAEAYVGQAKAKEPNAEAMDGELRNALKWIKIAHEEYRCLGCVNGLTSTEAKQKLLEEALGPSDFPVERGNEVDME